VSDATRPPDRAGAVAAIERAAAAIRRDPRDAPAWSALGAAYFALGQHHDAEQALARAVTLEPRDLAAALLHAASLLELGRPDDALVRADATASAHPTSADAHFLRGNACAALGRHDAAVDAFARVSALDPANAQAHYNRALALDELGRWSEAARACEAALALDSELWPALAQLAFLKRRLCEWDGLDVVAARLREAVRDRREGITPFSFLSEPASPDEQLRCARTWAATIVARTAGVTVGGAEAPTAHRSTGAKSIGASAPPTVTPAASAKLRVGFVSSGFNNHPTALLIVDLIERLRTSPLTTIGFATTPSDGGALRERIARAFHEFIPIDLLDHAHMAQRIRDARIDVLIDLRGYGGGSVSEVFAMRPAPVQVNWLAYPATSGASFIDVMIADRYVVPPSHERHYSERIVRMPHAFQPSDATRVASTPPSRVECGLPERGTVFASFNNSYKIAPATFARWLEILAAVQDSVLWLLAGKDEAPARANLAARAAAADVDPARLVFMRKLPHLEYLARYAHVDLFLDTWPYNAHTTASDALYAGCPLLTLPGETFASRVAGSLVTTLGLPELVARDEGDYVAKAVAVAHEAPAWRERVRRARATSPLFDMRRFASDLSELISTS